MGLDKSLHNSKHDVDPKTAIVEAIGALTGYALSGHQVLIGIYVRPAATVSGFIHHNTARKEDEYQGKVGIILKMGPLAFSELAPAWPDQKTPAVGDWVGFRQMEGVARSINGKMCKIFEDKQIRELLPHPDFIA